MKRCIFRTDEVHFSNAENLGTLPGLKKLKAWYNSSLRCSHPGNTALVHKWPWKFRPGEANALLLPNHASPDTVPTTHWCPAHLKTFKSWFTKGWIAKLITSNYISAGWGRGASAHLSSWGQLNMKFGSNHFQHLAPLPEDLCVPSRSHTPQPGGRGGCEIVPAGEGGGRQRWQRNHYLHEKINPHNPT